MSMFPRPRKWTKEDELRARSHQQFDPEQKLTRLELYIELLDNWELNVAVADNIAGVVPGAALAAADLRKAIKVLKKTYSLDKLMGCSHTTIENIVNSVTEKPSDNKTEA